MDLPQEKAQDLLESQSRRNFLKATGGLAAVVGIASGELDSNNQGNLSGGTMALEQAYRVSDKQWIGPDSAKSNVEAKSGRVYKAVDTQVEYYGDSGNWRGPLGVGSSSKPVQSINAEEANNVRHVPKFGTIQEAHDDLPSDGGKIVVDEDISETGWTITKPVVLEGHGGGFFGGTNSDRDEVPATVIDTSGANGGLIDNGNVTIRDLRIEGDRTSGYGLQIGTAASNVRGFLAENVSVQKQGGNNVILKGEHVFPTFRHFMTQNAAGHGFVIDATDYCNAPTFEQFTSANHDKDGFHVTNTGNVLGVTANGFTVQKNGSHGIYSDNANFGKSYIRGYGCEGNTNGMSIDGKGMIKLEFNRLSSGFSSVTYNGGGVLEVWLATVSKAKVFGPQNSTDFEWIMPDGQVDLGNGNLKGSFGNLDLGGSYLGVNGPMIFNTETRWNTGSESTTSDSMTANPETDTEDGYIPINVGGSTYHIPIYNP